MAKDSTEVINVGPTPEPKPNPTTTTTSSPDDTATSDFDSVVDKDLKLDRLLVQAVQTIKRMHEIKMEIRSNQNQFDEDKTRLLKSLYLTLHTEKLSNFNEILKAVEEITR